MRRVGLILGGVGGLACGALGVHWLGEAERSEANPVLAYALGRDPEQLKLAAILLVAAMLAGVLGGIAAHRSRSRAAGVLMVIAGALPGIIDPRAFVATCVLILAGLLCIDVCAEHRVRRLSGLGPGRTRR